MAEDISLCRGDPEIHAGWGADLSTEDGLALWVGLRGMDSDDETALPDAATGDGRDGRVRTWRRAGAGELVQLDQVNVGGDDWPGAWGLRDRNASESVWAFASQYP